MAVFDVKDGSVSSAQINMVKVFSVSKAKDRDSLGDRVTAWIAANPGARILRTTVALTSDNRFHCLSIVLSCAGP